tara:strand:+ start:2437 stop:3714 length:1278 start_codon:yes stop_codon:yes gene_type:complete
MSLPREVEYRVSSLPAEVSTAAYVSRAVNGSSFTTGQQVQVNLIQNRGTYLIPSSMYATFNINVTADGADTNVLLGLPGVSVIERSDIFANSTSIDTINNYNGIVNMLYNGKLGVSEKMGLSKCLGNAFVQDAANQVDSRDIANGTGANIISVAVPLCNILTLMDKLLPLDSAEYRVYLTVADILNISCKNDGAASTLSLFSLSDFQIHYKAVTFDAQTDQMIKSQVQPDGCIYMKSESYQSSVANLPTGSAGSVALPFANSLTSIKSLQTQFCRSDRFGVGCGAAYDPQFTQFNYEVAGRNYPQTALSSTAVAGVTLEFLESIHGIMSHPDAAQTSMSVNNFRILNAAFGADSFKDLPKAYFGYNSERLPSTTALNGISSMNSNIVTRLSIGTATTATSTVLQIFHHDCILKYDPLANSLVVMR